MMLETVGVGYIVFFFLMVIVIAWVFVGSGETKTNSPDDRNAKKSFDYYDPENWMLAGDEWVHIKSGERRG